ncbi:hypothetical protein C6376_08750 [Streptomyces sp. P3]|uniref:hypothetical protein n=1 Tax=Streptomyces sp. P3 TaxID=2135430 RepID=UPI000D1A28A9|nr:hypothetical protein [Streptomyces sp. P3]AVV41513.1 hypothetical protein C6376_08750 [Streptomyces sp. P3]
MRSPTRTHGRRGALWGASAAAVLAVGAAGLLAGCGGDGGGGDYVALGSAGDSVRPGMGGPGGPTGGIRLVPLDGENGSSTGKPGQDQGPGPGSPSGSGPRPGTPTQAPGADSGAGADADAGEDRAAGASNTAGDPADGTPPNPPTTPSSPGPTGPSGPSSPAPADLTVSEPVRAGTEQRWCEDVSLVFHNSGGRSVVSGTVAFGTHVVDGLGIDWATRESTVPLPTPISAGARKEKTWRVCVDAWRVPLGMHIETRDVTVQWH